MKLGWLWFAVLFERPYAIVLGRSNEPKSKMAPLYFVGPSLCMLVTAAASAVLMKAAGVESLEEALGIGALVRICFLSATAMNMDINPNIPRPIAYGLMSAGHFFVASILISAILCLVS